MIQVHLLFGPESGRGRVEGAASTIDRVVRAEGYEPVDLTGSDQASSRRALADAVGAGAERIVVAGGDGMVHLALQEVAGTSTILGVVPVGTGNDFSRAFRTSSSGSIEQATRRALEEPTSVDAIRTDRGWIASVATAGFSGDVNSRANRLRWPRGRRRYTVATLLEIPRLRARPLRLVVDDQEHDLEVTLLAVANTAWFGGGMQICPDARPDDGLLDVTVVVRIGRLALLRYFPRVFSGNHLSHPCSATFRGRRVSVEGAALDVWGDGEPLGPGPITFTAVPGALRLAV